MLKCQVAGIEAVAAATRHRFPRHSHDQFGIGVIDQGAQKSHSCLGLVEAGPGDIITVNAGEVHDGMPIGDAGRSWRMLYLDPALIATASRDISAGKTEAYEFRLPVLRDARIARQFRQLFACLTRGAAEPGLAMLQEQSLLRLLAAMRRLSGKPVQAGSMPAAIALARQLIDDDPTAPIALADLAQVSGLSRFQVLRGFVRATELTPHAYLVQRRIALARRLIGSGSGLADAAVASGFADQSHMTRIFVRKYGVSPGAYAAATA